MSERDDFAMEDAHARACKHENCYTIRMCADCGTIVSFEDPPDTIYRVELSCSEWSRE